MYDEATERIKEFNGMTNSNESKIFNDLERKKLVMMYRVRKKALWHTIQVSFDPLASPFALAMGSPGRKIACTVTLACAPMCPACTVYC